MDTDTWKYKVSAFRRTKNQIERTKTRFYSSNEIREKMLFLKKKNVFFKMLKTREKMFKLGHFLTKKFWHLKWFKWCSNWFKIILKILLNRSWSTLDDGWLVTAPTCIPMLLAWLKAQKVLFWAGKLRVLTFSYKKVARLKSMIPIYTF